MEQLDLTMAKKFDADERVEDIVALNDKFLAVYLLKYKFPGIDERTKIDEHAIDKMINDYLTKKTRTLKIAILMA